MYRRNPILFYGWATVVRKLPRSYGCMHRKSLIVFRPCAKVVRKLLMEKICPSLRSKMSMTTTVLLCLSKRRYFAKTYCYIRGRELMFSNVRCPRRDTNLKQKISTLQTKSQHTSNKNSARFKQKVSTLQTKNQHTSNKKSAHFKQKVSTLQTKISTLQTKICTLQRKSQHTSNKTSLLQTKVKK